MTSQEHTFRGISEWYETLFSKFGWLLLVQGLIKERKASRIADFSTESKAKLNKLMTYVIDIKRCLAAVEARNRHEKDSGRKQDLKIMKHHLTILHGRATEMCREITGTTPSWE